MENFTSGNSKAINDLLNSLETSLDTVWRKKLKRQLSDYLYTSQTFTSFLMKVISEDVYAEESQIKEESERKIEIVIIELVDALKDLDDLGLEDPRLNVNTKSSTTKCEKAIKPLCRNTELCKGKRKSTICEKVKTFALKNFEMIQTRSMSKTHEQVSSIVAKHLVIGSSYAKFDKEEQRLFKKSSLEILTKLQSPILPMRSEFETVESMLQRIQQNLLMQEGES